MSGENVDGVRFCHRDVFVQWGDGPEVRIFDRYGLLLACSRTGGWELWDTSGPQDVLLAGEYGSAPLRIRVGDKVILDGLDC